MGSLDAVSAHSVTEHLLLHGVRAQAISLHREQARDQIGKFYECQLEIFGILTSSL